MDEINQHAEGNNINQAGGDITIQTPQPVSTENLIACPECQHRVSRHATSCPACGFPVGKYFAEIQLAKNNKRQELYITVFYTILIPSITLVLYFMTPDFPFKKYIIIGCIVSMPLTLGYRYLMRKLVD